LARPVEQAASIALAARCRREVKLGAVAPAARHPLIALATSLQHCKR
jgi:hypothetical protein